MNKPKLQGMLGDQCPKCSRHTLHKLARYCVAYGCGFSEPLPEITKTPKSRRARKS